MKNLNKLVRFAVQSIFRNVSFLISGVCQEKTKFFVFSHSVTAHYAAGLRQNILEDLLDLVSELVLLWKVAQAIQEAFAVYFIRHH